ncbi:MAG: yajC [Candidatus Binatus sp.]|jgi:preprotein translocase subunit YajC|nr:yajC [Candidatus Binatus sp.]
MFFEGTAWAQAAASPGGEYAGIIQMAPIVAVVAVFWFLVIRPQTQKSKEHAKMLAELKRNDEVVTTGGLIGRIVELGDAVATLELAPNVRVRVDRTQIASLSTFGKTSSKKDDKS